MKVDGKPYRTIWLGVDGTTVQAIDQTLLPGTVVDRVTDTTDDLVEAIAVLAVRGAPALGVAGAMGVVVAMDEGAREGWDEAVEEAYTLYGGGNVRVTRTSVDFDKVRAAFEPVDV